MIETFVDLDTDDATMTTFVVHPDGHEPDRSGPFPVIVFLMDAPGMREELRDMCRRLATTGYYVMAPHLYYRTVTEFDVFATGDRDRMHELMDTLSNSMVDADVGVCLAHAAGDPMADPGKVGTVGYCMSGPFAITAAAAHAGQVRAAASIHGVRLAIDHEESPHRCLSGIDAELYVACAEVDAWAPPELIDTFGAAMAEHGSRGRIEWFPGTEHGFAFRERPAYDKASSERHWERLHGLFDRNLRP